MTIYSLDVLLSLFGIDYHYILLMVIHIPCMVPWGFPGGPEIKNSPTNAGVTGDTGLILESGRSPKEGNGYPLHIGYLLLPIASLLMNINLFLVVNSINTFVISSFDICTILLYDCAIIGTVNCFYLKLLIHVKLTLMCIRRWGFNFFLYFSANVMMPWVEQFHYGIP